MQPRRNRSSLFLALRDSIRAADPALPIHFVAVLARTAIEADLAVVTARGSVYLVPEGAR